ncbi:Kelch repeat-containing protein [Robertmurraya siralis]|uniref:Kelch repeat-containing protein n=1 Tax=Robertmurraya siralis TaxID=77777 RepID=UPI0010F81318|nr:kelch repeat-containing protein [Robertmurraya siralis]
MATGRVNVGGGGAGLNVYTEVNEPPKKEGVWIKTDKKYKKIISDTMAWIANSFRDPSLIADMPTPRFGVRTVYCNGAIYAIGGQQNSSFYGRCYKYDIVSNTWSEITSPQYLIAGGHSVDAIDNKIYVIGGYTQTGTANPLGVVQIYDTNTGVWSLGTTMTGANAGILTLYGHSSAVHDRKIYCFDGRSGGGVNFAYMIAYDVDADNWSIVHQNMSSGYYFNAPAFYVGGYIYQFYSGIISPTATRIRRIKLDTGDIDILPDAPFLVPRHDEGVLVDGNVYLCSETDFYEFDTTNHVFDLVSPLPSDLYGRLGKRLAYYDGIIYFMGSGVNASTQLGETTSFSFIPKIYDEGTFVLIRTDNFYGLYKTELVTPFNISGDFIRMVTSFDNAYLFVDNTLLSLESYYGDGAQWIKFKEDSVS